MKFISLIFTLQALLFAANYSFIDTSINYLDWSQKTEEKTSQRDFVYLELEGGAGWDWGEFYGFFDIENPLSSYDDAPADDLRFVAKPIFDIYIKDTFALHIQNFHLHSKEFYVNNFVTALSYKYSSEDSSFWITPFLGGHYQNSTFYSGFNGYMLGWSFNYDFSLFEQNFSLFNWNEIEFARAKESYELEDGTKIGDESPYGINGALSLWWNINSDFKTGLQYRYAKFKLGSKEYQSGLIYSLKYFF